MRREWILLQEDEECLRANGYEWETVLENKVMWLIVLNYEVVEGYNVLVAKAALRVPPSYPDEQIDMVYFNPPLALMDGRGIGALSMATIDGQQYQQWSRHRTGANPWRPGLDSICTHLAQVKTWLEREIRKVA